MHLLYFDDALLCSADCDEEQRSVGGCTCMLAGRNGVVSIKLQAIFKFSIYFAGINKTIICAVAGTKEGKMWRGLKGTKGQVISI